MTEASDNELKKVQKLGVPKIGMKKLLFPSPTEALFKILQRDADDGPTPTMKRLLRSIQDAEAVLLEAIDQKAMNIPMGDDDIERLGLILGEVLFRNYVMICASAELQPIIVEEFLRLVKNARAKRG